MELIFLAIAIKDQIGYVSDFERNGLFEVNIETGESRYICLFPNEKTTLAGLHCHGEWIGNKVYFIPAAGNYLSVYHTDTKEIESIELPDGSKTQNGSYRRNLKFAKALQYGGFLWLIPATYPGILKLNPCTDEITLIDSWISDDTYLFRRAVCLRGNTLYAASGDNNHVLIFDMDSETGKIVNIGKFNHGIMDMCTCGDDFVMAPRNSGAVIQWNPASNEIREYGEYPEGFKPGDLVFETIYEYQSQLILAPGRSSFGIRLSKGRLLEESDIPWKSDSKNSVGLMFKTDDRLYFREKLPGGLNRFYFIDKKSNELHGCRFFVSNPKERRRAIAEAAIENQEAVRESPTFRLQDWIKTID